MKYFIIGDEDAVLGFGMVGVKGRVAVDQKQAEDAFHEALADSSVGIVMITERIAELIRPLVDRFIFTEKFPLIVEITDRKGPIEGKPSLRKMVNEAIGISL
jgi:V/A-type H+-transporting ATPase subunit F